MRNLTFDDDVRGSLGPGKLADFVVLDADVATIDANPDALLTMQENVLATVVGGNVVYRKLGFELR